jgi:hypothetical protein
MMPPSPYPEPTPDAPAGAAIAAVAYDSPLVLTRGIEAVKARSGRDADYIVGRDYAVRYRLGGETAWRSVVVPAGLTSDLASVPRPVWWLINRVGPHLEASIVHDWLYVAWQDLPAGRPRKADRAFADRLFLALMAEARVSWAQRRVIYWSVRVFGWGTYRRPDPVRHVPMPAL